MKRTVIALLLLGLIPASGTCLAFERQVGRLIVGVNLNSELLYSMVNLTDFSLTLPEGTRPGPLLQSVRKHFGRFKIHPAVAELEGGLNLNCYKGFCFDVLNSFPLYFSDLPEGKRIYDYQDADFLDRILEGKTKEQKVKYMDAYWEKVRDFYKTSGYQAFFDSNAELYKTYVDTVCANLPPVDIIKLHEDFHGKRPYDNYYLVPSMLAFPNGNYGPFMGKSAFSFLASESISNATYLKDMLYHEFGHSFCNPVVDRYAADLKKYEFLMKGLQEDMRAQYYSDWPTVMRELLVRSVHARLLRKTETEEKVGKFLADEKNRRKFVFIEDFYRLLGEYEANRDKYPTLYEFYPRLVESLSDWELKLTEEPVKTGIYAKTVGNGLLIYGIAESRYAYGAGFRLEDTVTAVDGKKPPQDFFDSLQKGRTYLVSIMHKNGSLGIIKFKPEFKTLLRPVRKAAD